jgi:hypothetical protein
MSNKSIATIATMGIDIDKNSFHVVGLDQPIVPATEVVVGSTSGVPRIPADFAATRQWAASGRCCRKSRKLSSSRNLAKDSVYLPPLLQASVRCVLSSVVAFL